MTITLKALKPSADELSQSQVEKEPLLTLNFNYNLFSDFGENPNPSSVMLPSVHLMRNLYLSFNLSEREFNMIKEEATSLIEKNPALVQLLKITPTIIQG